MLNMKVGAANMAGAWFIHRPVQPVCAGAANACFIQTAGPGLHAPSWQYDIHASVLKTFTASIIATLSVIYQ